MWILKLGFFSFFFWKEMIVKREGGDGAEDEDRGKEEGFGVR